MLKYYKAFAYDTVPEPHPQIEIDNRPLEALGEVVMKFEALDAQLAAAIGFMLAQGDDVAGAVTSPMSFQVKLKVFSGLVRALYPHANLEKLRELCQVCSEAEQKRNMAIHSRWDRSEDPNAMVRSKTTVGLKHGLSTQNEQLHVYEIMDIGGYCTYAACSRRQPLLRHRRCYDLACGWRG